MVNDKEQCQIINQLHTLANKLKSKDSYDAIDRNYTRILASLESMGYHVKNPLGESYDDTRLDCEASITGDGVDNLVIIEVIKPIVYKEIDGAKTLLQRAVVIVSDSKEGI